MNVLLGAGAAYLVGCVPAGRVARRLAGERGWAPWAEVLADFAKGYLAVMLFSSPITAIGQALTLTALIAGDQWPIFGPEKGRLGLWAGGGGMTAITPIAPVLWTVLWAIGFVLSGYKVVGRFVALLAIVPVLGFVAGWPIGLIAAPGVVMVLERTRPDLLRVKSGEATKHHWRDET